MARQTSKWLKQMTVQLMLTPSLRKRKNFPFTPISVCESVNLAKMYIRMHELTNLYICTDARTSVCIYVNIRLYNLQLSRRLTLIKSSRAIIHVRWLKITDVSGTSFAPSSDLWCNHSPDDGYRAKIIPETSVIFNQLVRLTVRKDFIKYKAQPYHVL
jgi:hypothetical protein